MRRVSSRGLQPLHQLVRRRPHCFGLARRLVGSRRGGETAEAVEEFGLDGRMDHVSTGGGAFLEYVEGTEFAPLQQIDDR